MRTITLQIDVTDEEKIFEAVPRAEYERAVGYLLSWAKDAYPYVALCAPGPREGALVALYRKEAGQHRPDYVIGAIWHEDSGATTGHYGFHS